MENSAQATLEKLAVARLAERSLIAAHLSPAHPVAQCLRWVGRNGGFVSGFRGSDGLIRGRPFGVSVDPRGALIVADDLSNTIWRVAPVR